MPSGKGGKNRRRGKNENEREKRELVFKEDGQGNLNNTRESHLYQIIFDICTHFVYVEYAQVLKMLGNGRLQALCFDGVERLCHIRGKLRKKVSAFVCFVMCEST